MHNREKCAERWLTYPSMLICPRHKYLILALEHTVKLKPNQALAKERTHIHTHTNKNTRTKHENERESSRNENFFVVAAASGGLPVKLNLWLKVPRKFQNETSQRDVIFRPSYINNMKQDEQQHNSMKYLD